MTTVLGSAYWPNIHYIYYIINSDSVCIDLFEHFEKQSYRNRSKILSANGELNLTVPVKKWSDHSPMKSIEISYAEDWQKQHWRAITSAYKNSPYFDFLQDEIKVFYESRFQYLNELNAEQLKWVLKVFRMKKEIIYSEKYIEPNDFNFDFDLRNTIHPKKEMIDKKGKLVLEKPYYQTFASKFGFTPNLSILDLIFNEGIKSDRFLV